MYLQLFIYFFYSYYDLSIRFQVTSLVSDQPSNKKKGRSKRAHLLVANVVQATEDFIYKANEIANENPDMRNDLLQSMEEVKRTGKTNDNDEYTYTYGLIDYRRR